MMCVCLLRTGAISPNLQLLPAKYSSLRHLPPSLGHVSITRCTTECASQSSEDGRRLPGSLKHTSSMYVCSMWQTKKGPFPRSFCFSVTYNSTRNSSAHLIVTFSECTNIVSPYPSIHGTFRPIFEFVWRLS